MLALSEVPDASALPEVIDYAWNLETEEESANWYITPFYDGKKLTFQDEVPTDVVRSLARLHYHFQERTERFASLYRVNRPFFKITLTNVVKFGRGSGENSKSYLREWAGEPAKNKKEQTDLSSTGATACHAHTRGYVPR
jgi:hypothetical protein